MTKRFLTGDPNMGILVVSSNPFFKDVLAGILAGRDLDGIVFTEPSCAANTSSEVRPRVILVDEATDGTCVAGILSEVRRLPDCRLIFLEQEKNEMVVFDSWRARINEVGDFIAAVRGSSPPNKNQYDECLCRADE
jgi:hypothetical protein